MASTDRIEKSIVLRAPRGRVWRALTNAEEFATWFRARIEGSFRTGATVAAASTYPGHENSRWEMKIVAMEPETLFAFTWPADESNQDPADWNRVEFRLEEVPEGTRLTVIETGFDRLPAASRAQALRNNEGGWTEQMQNIRGHVEA